MKEVFQSIYKGNMWGDKESVSGPGSTVESTKDIAAMMPLLVNQFHIKSILDAACGDLNWMQRINLDIDRYIGVDIVPELIESNSRLYSNSKREFLCLDISKDALPEVDLIICRDCLVHLPFDAIFAALKNFKQSGSKYVLMTTFTEHFENYNISPGDWRFLNFEIEPFNFPKPIYIIKEKYNVDKSLALWSLDSLNL